VDDLIERVERRLIAHHLAPQGRASRVRQGQTSAPKRPAIAASTSPPGAWASRARASASMIVAPQRWKKSTTVDLPAAMLPVSATSALRVAPSVLHPPSATLWQWRQLAS